MLWCTLAWARYLLSHFRYKFINVWGQAPSWGHSQDWVKVFISKVTPVWWFVYLHQREKLFTAVCAAKHREHLSSLGTQLGHCVWMKHGNCAVPRVILCLECVATLEFNQLHLEVGWGAFHINGKCITEQFKPTLSMPSFSANCALGNTETCSFIVWQHRKWPRFSCSVCISHRRS